MWIFINEKLAGEEMKEHIKELLTNGQYEEADIYLNENITIQNYDDEIAIFDGTIGLYYGDGHRVWQACANGLTLNPKNYELYVILGEYYLGSNINQAYLCYENALFHCNKDEDRIIIKEVIDKLLESGEVTVRKASFVILSYNLLEYTKVCVESIRAKTPESSREIVVVDNASEDGSVEWLRAQKDVVLVENKENSGFPKGCNIGIEASDKENDIFLLNNDTYMTENALFWLRMGLYENAEVGTTGCVSNYCGNHQRVTENISDVDELIRYGFTNNIPMEFPYEGKLFLIGFALLIKREVINKVGLLDERYTPGNYEDNDYGLRVIKAGYKNILCRNSFIVHFGSKTFRKASDDYTCILSLNRKKFEEKWGIDPHEYFLPNKDVLEVFEEPMETELKVLDVGCGCGAMLRYVKGKYPYMHAYGVEKLEQAAEFAKYVGETVCGDIEQVDLPWEEEIFDYIILEEMVSQLQRPDMVLTKLRKHLKKGGKLIVCVGGATTTITK